MALPLQIPFTRHTPPTTSAITTLFCSLYELSFIYCICKCLLSCFHMPHNLLQTHSFVVKWNCKQFIVSLLPLEDSHCMRGMCVSVYVCALALSFALVIGFSLSDILLYTCYIKAFVLFFYLFCCYLFVFTSLITHKYVHTW